MVQEFHVLRCFSCESFQVQQVKKANRWSCKMCGEKQSLLKEFGRGSGADCRRHVQKLNATRGAMMEQQEDDTWSLWEEEEEEEEEAGGEEEAEQEADDQVGQTQVSRWNRYLSAPEEAEPESNPEEDGVLMDREQLHGNNMTDRKKKRTDTRHREPTPAQSSASNLRRKLVGPSTTSLTQSGPTQSSPTQSGPSRSSPTLSGPTLSGPTRSAPTLSGPTRSGPIRSSPTLSGPTLSGPTRSGPTLSGLIQSSPIQSGPIQSSPIRSSPPSKKRATGPVSKWTQFLSSACQEQEGAGLPMSGAASPSNQVIRPCPPLPGSSLFETGEEFSFEDEDLNQ